MYRQVVYTKITVEESVLALHVVTQILKCLKRLD